MLQPVEVDESALPTDADSYRIDLATARILLLRAERFLLGCWVICTALLTAVFLSEPGWAGVGSYSLNMALCTCGFGFSAWIQRRRLPSTVARDRPRLILTRGRLTVVQELLQHAPIRVEVPATACRIRRLRRKSATERDFTEVQIPLPPTWLLGPTLHVPVYDRVPGAREFCRALRSAGARRLPRCGVLRYYWRETHFGVPCIDAWQRHLWLAVGAIVAVTTVLQDRFPQNPGIWGTWFLGSVLTIQCVFFPRHWLSARRRSRSNGLTLQLALKPSGDSGGLAAV